MTPASESADEGENAPEELADSGARAAASSVPKTGDPKSRYRDYCRTSPDLPIYHYDWWLDSLVGTDGWGVAIDDDKGMVRGTLPFAVLRRGPFRILGMPPLTPYLGPHLNPPPGQKYERRLAFEKETILRLLDRLPEHDAFSQALAPDLSNWLPFHWRGFQSSLRCTYVADLRTPDLLAQFKSSARGKLQKAAKLVTISDTMPIEEFYSINRLTFSRQGLPIPYSLDLLKRHDAILLAHNARRIFSAYDGSGVHSALYLTWDTTTVRLHLAGEDPALRKSGAGILLIWHAMKFAQETLGRRYFDFEGSMIESVEEIRRACGGRQMPFIHVRRVPHPALALAWKVRDLVREWKTSRRFH